MLRTGSVLLTLSLGEAKPSADGIAGWQTYSIEFSDELDILDKYALAWISPRYPTVESMDHLDNIKGWWNGVHKQIFQEDITRSIPFKVRLYLLESTGGSTLLDERVYEELQPA